MEKRQPINVVLWMKTVIEEPGQSSPLSLLQLSVVLKIRLKFSFRAILVQKKRIVEVFDRVWCIRQVPYLVSITLLIVWHGGQEWARIGSSENAGI